MSITIPQETLLASKLFPGQDFAPATFMIREIDVMGEEINRLAGDPAVLDRDPMTGIIPVLDSHWEIAVAPTAG
ncbi:hypothetical protein SAMN04488003_101343 [Loktanella fryxellensis]|uniref:Uncharacterized protein n=1 Tax=Loktanella fryxellensis TaxID=245187 RepID=A0A1H7YYI0_9RHOB|nr:hypothetical protein [Loktanella fryxellensis]SEM50418.1 hypothetical protein SAMN04488003_101343 [Loktanella fryxellensis]